MANFKEKWASNVSIFDISKKICEFYLHDLQVQYHVLAQTEPAISMTTTPLKVRPESIWCIVSVLIYRRRLYLESQNNYPWKKQ